MTYAPLAIPVRKTTFNERKPHGKDMMARYVMMAMVLAGTTSGAMTGPLDEYWANLNAMCGNAYEGTLIIHPEGETGFVGRRLVMHVRDCSEERIRIPFVVGDDYSRTWVLTRRGDRIELKHDHRHENGTPHELTMYGGTTTNQGRAHEQYFPADEHTRKVTEPAFSNVWMMRIYPEKTFTYGLWRLGTPRVFQIDFDLTETVGPPAAPWGWED